MVHIVQAFHTSSGKTSALLLTFLCKFFLQAYEDSI